MRRLRLSLGLAVLCALALAAPAMAHNFTASRLVKPLSEAAPGVTRGVGSESEVGIGEHSQELRFGNFEIFCGALTQAKTINEGAITWATSQTLAAEVKFVKCLTKAGFGGGFFGGIKTNFNYNPETKKAEPVKFVWHVNGFAEFGTGETFSEVEVGNGETTFNIAGKICKISWPAQTVPARAEVKPEGEYSSAIYSVLPHPVAKSKYFPTEVQNRLIISNVFRGMKWKFEGGQCLGEKGFEEEAKRTEGTGATYFGNLEMQLVNGNLGFE
jgi:hypothetical protein